MKTALLIIGVLFLIIAGLALPAGIGIAIYQFAFVEVGLGIALWAGFKAWATMLLVGLCVGYPSFFAAQL